MFLHPLPPPSRRQRWFTPPALWLSLLLTASSGRALAAPAAESPAPDKTPATAAEWKIGAPIVTYWAGPGFPGGGDLTDAAAAQMKAGGWNLVWCRENELDTVQRHGLRGMLSSDLLNPASLDDAGKREALEALVSRVKKHPGFYTYHLTDEPGAGAFPALGRLVAWLRERDPEHLAYINLLPTYANNEQLGVPGPPVEAYTRHLRQFVDTVRPSLLSYDHYQFTNSGDNPDYFLNLALVRGQALASGLPFMNIVQASTWVPTQLASPQSPRIPGPDEMRCLVYTTLAYGAQGISYYVYCYPAHEGGITKSDGTPTELYGALKVLNPEFVSIAKELRPLRSLNVFHTGMKLPGTHPPPPDSGFRFDPPVPDMGFKPGDRAQGLILSQFGPAAVDKKEDAPASPAITHVMVVNPDYKTTHTVTLLAPGALDVFDASQAQWAPAGDTGRAELQLPPGGGKLLRLRP